MQLKVQSSFAKITKASLPTLLRKVLFYHLYLVYLVIQTGLVIWWRGKRYHCKFLPGPPWKHNSLHISFWFIKMKRPLWLRKKPGGLPLEFSDPHWLPALTFCCCTTSLMSVYIGGFWMFLTIWPFVISTAPKVWFFWILIYVQDSNICY